MADSTDRRKCRIRRDADRAQRHAQRKASWTYGPEPPDDDGGAGVREPRRPAPPMPAGAVAVAEPVPVSLDLTAPLTNR